jgi:transcriptional regulator with XRE-family HTH domain
MPTRRRRRGRATATLPFGQRLADARKRLGLSARELSIKAGLDPCHVSVIESGRNPVVTLETAAKLATALGVTVGSLVDEDTGKPQTA